MFGPIPIPRHRPVTNIRAKMWTHACMHAAATMLYFPTNDVHSTSDIVQIGAGTIEAAANVGRKYVMEWNKRLTAWGGWGLGGVKGCMLC